MNPPSQKRKLNAWTFVEMLVAISLAAIFLGAASLVYASISVNSRRLTTVVTVNVGSANRQNLYGQAGDTLGTYSAPNFGRAASAADFRDLFRGDAAAASFLHCLPRSVRNTIRPEFLTFPAGSPNATTRPPRLDTPEAFRQFLAQALPASTAIYDTPVRNFPPANRPNTTVFMVGPSQDAGFLRVRAVYEIDYLNTTSPSGTYATVRRYRNGSLTHYYDVFFEAGPGSLPVPSFVAFENTSRLAVVEGTSIDRFKIASREPFYLLWLPDPSVNPLKVPTASASAPASSPLSAYGHLGSRSNLCLALPMFPGL
ncbi:MAG: hypothetical protein KGR69_03365 [Verrucomicrobia bacterium]|nr:hypothetical protein [Verrucomicrobiota bacterium]